MTVMTIADRLPALRLLAWVPYTSRKAGDPEAPVPKPTDLQCLANGACAYQTTHNKLLAVIEALKCCGESSTPSAEEDQRIPVTKMMEVPLSLLDPLPWQEPRRAMREGRPPNGRVVRLLKPVTHGIAELQLTSTGPCDFKGTSSSEPTAKLNLR